MLNVVARLEFEPGSCWPVAAGRPGGRASRLRTVATANDDNDGDSVVAVVGRTPDGTAVGADAGDGEACGGSAVLAGRGAWPPPPPVSSASLPLT